MSTNTDFTMLPGLSTQFTLRLIEVIPSHLEINWSVVLPEILDKSMRLAANMDSVAALHILQRHTSLSQREQSVLCNIDRVCRLFCLDKVCRRLIEFTLLMSSNEGVKSFVTSIEHSQSYLHLLRIWSRLFNCSSQQLFDALSNLDELGLIQSGEIESLSSVSYTHLTLPTIYSV